MKLTRISGGAFCLAAGLALSAAAQDAARPSLVVSALTTKTSIPGLDTSRLPPEALAALGGIAGGQRTLSVRLTDPAAAPPSAPNAELDIPASLKLGKTLVLEVPKPAGDRNPDAGSVFKALEGFEFRQYWGCSASVRPDQPKVIQAKDLPSFPLQMGQLPGGIFGGAKGTLAYWPNSRQAPQVPQDAALPGKYALRSNFAGGVGFEVPAGVNFLAPVALSTSAGPVPDLSKPITLSWKPVPGALGYFAMATATRDQKRMTMWTSAETGDVSALGGSGDVRQLVEKGGYMKPDRTECTIPAGIFDGCPAVSVVFRAVGPAFEAANLSPSVRVETESMATLVLGAGGFGN